MLMLTFLYISAALSAGRRLDFTCRGGLSPTPKLYRDEEVLLPHMRDPKDQRECELGNTPERQFNTYINECQPTDTKGQCTEWADGRIFQLTGRHMAFNGKAFEWPDLARQIADWVVTDVPTAPSVAISPPGVYGAGPSGHAAVIEHIDQSGNLCTSNWKAPTPGKLSLSIIRHHPDIRYISLAKR